MAMICGVKRRRGLEEEEEEDEEDEQRLDRISLLPDGVLGDIVTLLPTNDGARTQVLSSRWRHIWRSAPLNIDLDINPDYPLGANTVAASVISRILSAHRGPCRRFAIQEHYLHSGGLPATSMHGWLEYPALDRLQELELHYGRPYYSSSLHLPLLPPPASVHRFSSTLRAVSFGGCGFMDANSASGLHFPVLKQLSLSDVRFSESSLLGALLAACPALQSLLLKGTIGLPRVQIASPTLRSIGVHSDIRPMSLKHLIIEDAPCLERLLCSDWCSNITISVISAPQLLVLGPQSPRLEFDTTVFFQGSCFVSMKRVLHSVKILSLSEERLSLDVVIEFMKCFPYLERQERQERKMCGVVSTGILLAPLIFV